MSTSPCVLLIERESDLAELNEVILTGDGFRVQRVSPDAHPVRVVEQTCPGVVVLGISPAELKDWKIVDQLNANPRTNKIPVVVIAARQRTSAIAAAAPNVRNTVVMPYDIWQLEKAVQAALKLPPPAATLPGATKSVPNAQIVATGALARDAREIVLKTVDQLRQVGAYRGRFKELTPELVDHLGTILGAIIVGVRRGLPPQTVFAAPPIHKAIDEHVELRISQKLGAKAAVHEDQQLRDQIDHFVRGLVGKRGFTATDALNLSQIVNTYVDTLTREILEKFDHQSKPTG